MQYTFKEKVVIVTGGANGIGRCIADEFRTLGATDEQVMRERDENYRRLFGDP